MIAIKIDVKKIDKTLLFRGEKGTYLSLTLKDNRDGIDQYGNSGFCTQDVSREDREAGVRGPIIGNWKHVGGQQKPATRKLPPPKQQNQSEPEPEPEDHREEHPPRIGYGAMRKPTPEQDHSGPDIPF